MPHLIIDHKPCISWCVITISSRFGLSVTRRIEQGQLRSRIKIVSVFGMLFSALFHHLYCRLGHWKWAHDFIVIVWCSYFVAMLSAMLSHVSVNLAVIAIVFRCHSTILLHVINLQLYSSDSRLISDVNSVILQYKQHIRTHRIKAHRPRFVLMFNKKLVSVWQLASCYDLISGHGWQCWCDYLCFKDIECLLLCCCMCDAWCVWISLRLQHFYDF